MPAKGDENNMQLLLCSSVSQISGAEVPIGGIYGYSAAGSGGIKPHWSRGQTGRAITAEERFPGGKRRQEEKREAYLVGNQVMGKKNRRVVSIRLFLKLVPGSDTVVVEGRFFQKEARSKK